jgi:hypothetical protein
MTFSTRRNLFGIATLLLCAACHRGPAVFGPNPRRSQAECDAVIARVRADTSVLKAPRAGTRVLVIPPQPPPSAVQGRSATVWVPVDQRGRTRVGDVRVTGIPDRTYSREIQRAAAGAGWDRPVRDGCWVPGWGYLTFSFPRARLSVSDADTAQAVAVASQRVSEHGQDGLSLRDIHRTREWFSNELYALLVRDKSDSGGIGYANFDPFTDAQDDVGPFRYDAVTIAVDTFKVSFSMEHYGHERKTVQLAMRYVNGAWRIANFLYPGHPACHTDLARALTQYAARAAARQNPDSGGCGS